MMEKQWYLIKRRIATTHTDRARDYTKPLMISFDKEELEKALAENVEIELHTSDGTINGDGIVLFRQNNYVVLAKSYRGWYSLETELILFFITDNYCV